MKKITKTNFQGLRQLFPVLEKEEMRRYVGGNSDGYYYNSGWNGCGDYYGFPGSGDSSYYSQYDFDIGKVLGMVVGFMVWAMSILMLIFTELMGAQNTHWMICSIGREHGMVDM